MTVVQFGECTCKSVFQILRSMDFFGKTTLKLIKLHRSAALERFTEQGRVHFDGINRWRRYSTVE